MLNQRLVDIYESDDPSTLDILFGSRSIQDAIDRVQALERHQRAGSSGLGGGRAREDAGDGRAQEDEAAARDGERRDRGDPRAYGADAGGARRARRRPQRPLVDSKQQKLQDLSTLTASERAEAEEIDALQAASARIAAQIRAAQSRNTGPTQTPSNAGLIWPVQGPVTSPFGWRWGRMHEGIDIGVGYGTPIHAAAGGHGHLLRLGGGLRQLRRDRPRRQPRDGLRPSELDRGHVRPAGRARAR